MPHRRKTIGVILALALTLCTQGLLWAKESYTVAIIPAFPPVATHKAWVPFLDLLTKETGISFRPKVYEAMNAFERDIISSTAPDFIFANALQLVVAHDAQGYLPLVRGDLMVKSVLFVEKNSPIKEMGDLSGKRIAYVGEKNL